MMKSAGSIKQDIETLFSSASHRTGDAPGYSARVRNVLLALPQTARTLKSTHVLVASALLLLGGTLALAQELKLDKPGAQTTVDEGSSAWKKQWAVPEGFTINIDTEGYHYPTAIAFVPHPGNKPKDPLYFVTELRGQVKVVTNDRSVHTFAKGFLQTDSRGERAAGEAEFGLGGICLEPSHGYVFITFAYQDDDKILRNNMIRFKTKPGTFEIRPGSERAFTDVFAPYESGPSHQIGECAVHNDVLYVSIGDGFKSPLNSQQLDSLQGKIIRMDLNGKPVPTNPFYADSDVQKARNYIWAYGLRNPFGLAAVGDKLIAVENGLDVDRFLDVQRGQNYLWNGLDESIAANAVYVFLDSLGPVQMNYYQAQTPSFPNRFANQFYVALSGNDGVMRVPYGLHSRKMLGLPQYFLRKTTDLPQPVTGVAFGPDGLYFAPLLPVRKGKGAAIIKVKYEPKLAREMHNVTLAQLTSASELAEDGKEFMRAKGCFSCHQVTGVFELGGTKGPVLDQGNGPMVGRILKKISSKTYVKSMRALDARNEQPFKRYRQARNEVVEAHGLDRVRIWMKYHLLEPRFDRLYSAMPNMGLQPVEARAITHVLLEDAEGGTLEQKIKYWLPEPRYRYFAYTFVMGLILGLPAGLAPWWIARRRRV